jgi:hypothetical protein
MDSLERNDCVLIMRRAMRSAVNPEPTCENERFLTLFITNAGGW